MERKRAIFITATDYRGLNFRSQSVFLVVCVSGSLHQVVPKASGSLLNIITTWLPAEHHAGSKGFTFKAPIFRARDTKAPGHLLQHKASPSTSK